MLGFCKKDDKVSTYGLLSEHSKKSIRQWIEQLLGQGILAKSGEYNVIKITDTGRQVLRGELTPKLRQPSEGPANTQTRTATDPWKDVDRVLFDQLCELRTNFAQQSNVPVHVVFSDNSIKDMAKPILGHDQGPLRDNRHCDGCQTDTINTSQT